MKFAERKHLMPSDNKFARPQNPHLRFSKLRFFGLRRPKTTSFYSTSCVVLKLKEMANLLFSRLLFLLVSNKIAYFGVDIVNKML